jgi:hypothetical protein
MRTLKTLGSALLMALVLVMGIDYVSFAATGDSFILGKINHANAVTTLDRTTDGPALKLSTNNNGAAPFITNAKGKVTHLNADEVDGQSFSCPGGTVFHEGVCIEKVRRSSSLTSYFTAKQDCLDRHRRLPTMNELETFRNRSGTDFNSLEATGAMDTDGSVNWVIMVYPNGSFQWSNSSGLVVWYRCVKPAS